MAKVGGGSGLNFVARLDTQKFKKEKAEFEKMLADLKISTNKAGVGASGFDKKPLTEYQAEQVKIKQQAVELAKQKQEQAKAERSASQVLQDALKQERLAREAINTQIARNRLEQQQANQLTKEQAALNAKAANQKRPTLISNSQAEIDAYNKAQRGSVLYTATMKAETVERARATQAAGVQAIATNNLAIAGSSLINSTKQVTAATQASSRTKLEQARIDAINTLRIKENTQMLKAHAREVINDKGSLEQRRAALERLTFAYDRLGATERKTAAGMRLGTIVSGVSKQVGELEQATNRGQRSVGQYGGAFTNLKETLLGVAGTYVSLYAAINAGKAIFENNVHLSDEFVDVQRTAKLSNDEVDNLGKTLKGLNTRTTLDKLLDIGFEGGRLGVKKDEIVDFIQTVDKLAVVLKKELPGGASQVSETLGKIAIVYKVAEKEGVSLAEAMNKIASAQLDLAHDGPVTVKYIQDFTLGVAGTATTAKLSLPVIQAYGAVLGGAGQIASSAGLALTRVVNDLSIKREKYFAIAQLADANLTLKEFTDLINNDTKSALDLFFKGLKAGNPAQTELADRLNTVGLRTGKVSNAVKILAENQDLLTRKIDLNSDSYERATSVDHNFELANNSLAASLEKIKNSIANAFTSSSFSRSLAEMLNGLTDARDSSQKLTDEYEDNKHKSEELERALKPLVSRYDELKGKTNLNSTESEELRGIIEKIGILVPGVVTEYGKYNEILDINRGKIDQLSKAQRELLRVQNKDVVKEANRSFEDAIKQQQFFQKKSLEIAKNNGPNSAIVAYQDYAILKAGDAEKAAEAIKKLGGTLTKAQQQFLEGRKDKPIKKKNEKAEVMGTGELVDETLNDRTTDVIKAEIKALQTANKKLAITSDEFKSNIAKIKERRKELKLALGGTDTEGIRNANQVESAVKQQRTLQAEISALAKKGRTKQKSEDEQELADIDAKYDKIREKAIAFNASKKNKGLKVNLSGLLEAQDQERSAKIDDSKAKQLKIELEAQKRVYDELEQYKGKVGSESSEQMFADQIGNAKTYYDYLIERKNQLENGDEKAKGGNAGNGEYNRLQIEEVDKQIAEEVALNKKRDRDIYANALQAAMTYADQIKFIDAEFDRYKKALGTNVTKEQIAQLDFQRDAAKRNVNEQNAFAKSGYEKLLMDFDALTRGEIEKKIEVIKEGYRKEYAIGKLTAQQLASLIDEVNGQIGRLNGNNSFRNIISAIKEYRAQVKLLGADATGSKEAQDDVFGSIAQGAADVSSVVGEVASSFQELGIGGEGLQDALKGVQGILDGAGGIAKGIASGNPVEIVTGSIKLLTSAISLFNTKDKKLEKQISSYKQQLDSLGKAYAQLDRQVQNSVGTSVYTDQASQIENLKQQQIALTKARDLERNKKKADQGKLDEYQSKIDSIPNQIEDINKAIAQNLIQGTFKDLSNSLADALTTAFAAGEDGIEAMDKSLDAFIANAIKGQLRIALLEAPIKRFTDDLTEYAKGNNNSVLGFDFDKYKDELKKAGENFNDALKGAGDFFKDTGSASGSGGVGLVNKTVTEETASESNAIARATYDNQKRQLVVLSNTDKSLGLMYKGVMDSFVELQAINANTFRTANNTDLLNTKLDAIIKNTGKTGSTGYDKGN